MPNDDKKSIQQYKEDRESKSELQRVEETFSEQLAEAREDDRWNAYLDAVDFVGEYYNLDISKPDVLRIVMNLHGWDFTRKQLRRVSVMLTKDPEVEEKLKHYKGDLTAGMFWNKYELLYLSKHTEGEKVRLTNVYGLDGTAWRRVSNREDGENWKYLAKYEGGVPKEAAD